MGEKLHQPSRRHGHVDACLRADPEAEERGSAGADCNNESAQRLLRREQLSVIGGNRGLRADYLLASAAPAPRAQAGARTEPRPAQHTMIAAFPDITRTCSVSCTDIPSC